jgi:hypothetical protein
VTATVQCSPTSTELGEQAPLTGLEGEAGADRVAEWFTGRWGGAAAATLNARCDALGSARDWWHDQGWLTSHPLRPLQGSSTADHRRLAVVGLRPGPARRAVILGRAGHQGDPAFDPVRRYGVPR